MKLTLPQIGSIYNYFYSNSDYDLSIVNKLDTKYIDFSDGSCIATRSFYIQVLEKYLHYISD